jgi:hypothetical protein
VVVVGGDGDRIKDRHVDKRDREPAEIPPGTRYLWLIMNHRIGGSRPCS